MRFLSTVNHYKRLLPCFLLLVLSSNRIETGETLSKEDVNYIRSLGLLEADEKIIKFYSEDKNTVAGNFFTTQKMAKYWIDRRNLDKNQVSFAFYKDIASIDTNYMQGALTFAPYMMVTKKDGSPFRVCADVKKKK